MLLAGIAGGTFAMLGLTGRDPVTLAGVAAIAGGLALFVQGVTCAARWNVCTRTVGRERVDVFGMAAEIAGGGVCMALGGLVLAGVHPTAMLCTATTILGLALLRSAAMQEDVAEFAPTAAPIRASTLDDEGPASSVMVAVGGVVAALGILAALEVGPVVPMVLAALVAVALATVLAGGSMFARFVRRVG